MSGITKSIAAPVVIKSAIFCPRSIGSRAPVRAVIVVLTIGLMLTGCSAVELEERCFPTLAAVDIVAVGTDEITDKEVTGKEVTDYEEYVSHRDVSANENSGYIEFYYNMDKSYEPEYADDIKTAVDSFEEYYCYGCYYYFLSHVNKYCLI